MGNLGSYQKVMADRFSQTKTESLMVLLYEGMITKIKQSRERFEAGQVIPAKESAVRAMKIANALMDNLNFEEGGETAQNLEKLYFYIITELSYVSRGEKPDLHLANAQQILETLLRGWKTLEEKA